MGQRRGVRVVRKIVVTSIFGGLSYPLTNLLFEAQAQQLAMSAAVGAIALVVQLLVEVDQRLASVETGQAEKADEIRQVVAHGFQKVSTATETFSRLEATGLGTARFAELAGRAAEIGPDAPPLIREFAQAEMGRVTELFGALADGGLSREGEDHDYLLTLTRLVRRSIDATSLFAVDAAGMSSESGFWNSDLGQSYIELQSRAIHRGVRVRRIFIVENEDLAARSQFNLLCQTQVECGIEVRVLVPSRLTMRQKFRDYVLFDDTISYEVTPCVRFPVNSLEPRIQTTSLASRCLQVKDLIDDYAQLWAAATAPLPPQLTARASSADDPHLDQDSPAVAPSP